MPTNVAARMTLDADPGSLQGAVAAGILGCGPVILAIRRTKHAQIAALEAALLRAQDRRPPALQRRDARAHGPDGDLSHRHFRREPQARLSRLGPRRLVRAGLPVRRLRLLPQAVPAQAGRQRHLPGRRRGGTGGQPRHFYPRLPQARALAWPGADAHQRLAPVPAVADRGGSNRSEARGDVRPFVLPRHRRDRDGARHLPRGAGAGPRTDAHSDAGPVPDASAPP